MTASELSLRFGRDDHLVGTMTLPPHIDPGAPGLLLLNAGIIHRIGPHRWHVKLARQLAALGYPVLRFDPSGLGDSRVPPDAAPFGEQAVRDVSEAMDRLAAETGVQRFVIGGICSGAEHGFNAALVDERVAGVWMLDGFAFPTWRTRVRRYTVKLRGMPPQALWAALVRKLRQRLPGGAPPAAPQPEASVVESGAPPVRAFGESLGRLVGRGVGVYFIYSGSIIHTYNYASQLDDVFGHHPFMRQVRCDYRPDIDHTVTTLASQRELAALVSAWCVELAPPSGKRSARAG